jgi:hypothetical protein
MRLLKKRILICVLFLFVFFQGVKSQTNEHKNVIVINRVGWSGGFLGLFNAGMPELMINKELYPSTICKNYVISQCTTDTVQIKVFYLNLIFKKKVKKFSFKLMDKNNYFVFKYKPGLSSSPIIVQIKEADLEKFKKKRRVRKLIEKYQLE